MKSPDEVYLSDLSTLALVAGALTDAAVANSPMPGAGRPYLASATLYGLSRGRMGAGEHLDLLFEDVRLDPSMPWPMRYGGGLGLAPVLRLWATGAGAEEAARVLRAVFDEAEVDAVAGLVPPVVLDDAVAFRPTPPGLGPRRVRLLLVDVDPREFEGAEDGESASGATEIVTYAIGIGRIGT